MFSSIEDVVESFAKHNYIASRRIATVIYLATAMKKPVLVEGPAGVGKTDLAKVLAASLKEEMIRLQCYEGLDEGKALYEWEYAKQLLYTQILKDKVSEVLDGTKGLAEAVDRIASEDEVFFSERFIVAASADEGDQFGGAGRPADRRNRQGGRRVRGLPARIAVGFPGDRSRNRHLQGQENSAGHSDFEQRPRNVRRAEASLPASLYRFSRRASRNSAIVRLKVPEAAEKLAEEVVGVVQSLRKLDLKKTPGISETLDWVKALTLLNVQSS